MCRIALCCLALSFVPPGLCTEIKAVAVVERTKEDSISCVLIRGELSVVPSAALTGRALPTLVQYLSAALQIPVSAGAR